MSKIQAAITVHGEVQGVGYRYSVHRLAVQIGLCGYVQNNSDGTVLIITQGTSQAINTFIEHLKGKQLPGVLDHLDIRFEAMSQSHVGFSIRR